MSTMKNSAARRFALGLSVHLVALTILAPFNWSEARTRSTSVDAVDCIGENGQALSIDNQRALDLKKKAASGKAYRARIQGKVVSDSHQRCSSRSGSCHAHFEIQIGPNKADTVEVVYSEDFGQMKEPSVGESVEACGDFLNTSGQRNSGSSGAIIHWVHRSNCMDHEHGYVLVEGEDLYGMGADRNPRACRPGVEKR
jgi:hypothetical protein